MTTISTKTVKQLKDEATLLNIPGRSKMNREELILAIESAQLEDENEEEEEEVEIRCVGNQCVRVTKDNKVEKEIEKEIEKEEDEKETLPRGVVVLSSWRNTTFKEQGYVLFPYMLITKWINEINKVKSTKYVLEIDAIDLVVWFFYAG